MPAAACLQGIWPQAQGRHQGNQVRFREPGHAQEPKRTRRGVTSQSQPAAWDKTTNHLNRARSASLLATGHWPLGSCVFCAVLLS